MFFLLLQLPIYKTEKWRAPPFSASGRPFCWRGADMAARNRIAVVREILTAGGADAGAGYLMFW